MQVLPVGLVGATLLVQLGILFLIFLTNRVLPFGGAVPIQTKCDKAVLVLSLVTVSCVIFSDDLYKLSAPMFGDLVPISGISRGTTFAVLFVADLVVVFRLIHVTGGSKSSPFTTLLFLIPTLAIFLREPPSRFLIYGLVAGFLYLFGLVVERRGRHEIYIGSSRSQSVNEEYALIKTDTPAHAMINMGCLLIGLVTGYVTRPIPI